MSKPKVKLPKIKSFKILLILSCVILLILFVLTKTKPASSTVNQIYPDNLTSTATVNYNYSLQQTCGGQGCHCYDASPYQNADSILVDESDGVKTYRQTNGVTYGPYSGAGCQNQDWRTLGDDTRNYPNEGGIHPKWAAQWITIPQNINKITQVKFYWGDGLGGSLKLELINSAGITVAQKSQNGADFSSLNWAVTSGSQYKLKLTKNDSGDLILPVTSPCRGGIYSGQAAYECTWYSYDSWRNVFVSQEDVAFDNPKSHNSVDAYTGGYAESESARFDDISRTGGIARADIARMAVWGETLPKTCTVTPSSATITSPSSVNVTLSGNAYGTASEPVRLLAAKQDGTQIGSYSTSITPSATEFTNNNKYYYYLNSSTCNSANSSTCTTTTAVTLPAGDYYFHCDVPTAPGLCSGNPFCAPPVGTGTVNCSDWLSCSDSDSAALTVNAAAAAPQITSLKLTNVSDSQTSITGIYGTRPVIGRQATQQGAGWLNPMKITLNVTAGTGTGQKYYTAFYDQKRGGVNVRSAFNTSSTFLVDVQEMLKSNPQAGWLLRYDPGTSPPTSGTYYVWDHSVTTAGTDRTDCTANGCFVDISSFTELGYDIKNNASPTRQVLYTAFPISGRPSWKVTVDARMGSKRLYTAGYAVSSGGSDLETDMTPTR